MRRCFSGLFKLASINQQSMYNCVATRGFRVNSNVLFMKESATAISISAGTGIFNRMLLHQNARFLCSLQLRGCTDLIDIWCCMQVFSHPHVSVQKAVQERYEARVTSFLEECDDIEARRHFRLLYEGAGAKTIIAQPWSQRHYPRVHALKYGLKFLIQGCFV